MLVHGSKASLNKRRIGLTAQFCQTSVKMVPMNYTKSIAFEEDFRKPVLISGRDVFGKLNYVKTKECLQRQAAIWRKKNEIHNILSEILVKGFVESWVDSHKSSVCHFSKQ